MSVSALRSMPLGKRSELPLPAPWHYRVSVCKGGIHRILQLNKCAAGARWQAFGHLITRNALARLWATATGAAALEIASLPEAVRGTRN